MGNTIQHLDARIHVRVKLAPMYTDLHARPSGSFGDLGENDDFQWSGFAYDISQSGMRFELDEPLATGTDLEIILTLPGKEQITFKALGTVVRRHDDEEDLGPARMGLHFKQFASPEDRQALLDYIQHTADH